MQMGQKMVVLGALVAHAAAQAPATLDLPPLHLPRPDGEAVRHPAAAADPVLGHGPFRWFRTRSVAAVGSSARTGASEVVPERGAVRGGQDILRSRLAGRPRGDAESTWSSLVPGGHGDDGDHLGDVADTPFLEWMVTWLVPAGHEPLPTPDPSGWVGSLAQLVTGGDPAADDGPGPGPGPWRGLQLQSLRGDEDGPSLWPRFHFDFAKTRADDQRQVSLGAFHRLFPLSTGYQGYEDLVGRENTVDISVGASLQPLRTLTLSANVHVLRSEGASDAMRPGRAGPWPGIGAEIDFSMQYRFDRRMSLLLGCGRFFADEFETRSGPGEDVDFVYANVLHVF